MKIYLGLFFAVACCVTSFAQSKVKVDENSNCSPEAAAANTAGSRLTDRGEPDKGADYYRLAIQSDPKCGPAYNNLAAYYSTLKKYPEAILIYRKAIEADERWAWVYQSNLGKTYAAFGKYPEAIAAYREVLRLKPQEVSVYYSLAKVSLNANDGTSAASNAQSYLKAKGWHDDNSPYAVLIGYLGYRQAQRDNEAQSLLLEALTKIKKSEWAYKIIQSFNREIPDQDLLTLAVNQDKKTEARTYIGVNLFLSGKLQEAGEHLRWVKENGNHDFYEYKLALAELGRIEK